MLLVDFIAAHERDSPIVAALALIKLREAFDASGLDERPDGERTWQEFVTKHLPSIGFDRVTQLVGMMVHRGGLLRCRKCGVEAKCACGCGVPYLPVIPDWMKERAPPLERAANAIVADPGRSDRSIADELGINRRTVAKARKSAGVAHAPRDAPPDEKSPG
jgi:hypothetical protein